MNDNSISNDIKNQITEVDKYWEPNSGLNILTGVNGSGKTRLLDYIYSFKIPDTSPRFVIGTPIKDTPNLKFKNKFTLNAEKILEPISNFIRMEYIPILWRVYSEPTFSHEVMDNNSGNPLQNNHLGVDALGLMGHATLSQKIKVIPNINKSIVAYKAFVADKRHLIRDMENLSNTKNVVSQIENEILESYPLSKIEEVFKTFPEHINFKIEIPTQAELESRNSEVRFFSKETGQVIDPENLSSGEKIITYLLVAEQLGLFGNLDILLLDELDTHLNPALIKNYVEILYRIVRTGVQIIATTHNPIVASYVEQSDIWWMEKGKVLNKKTDIDEHKRTIVNKLSDGLFSADDIQGIFSLFTNNEKTHEWIFLVEGKHDAITLLTQFIGELNPENSWPVINCKGAGNIKYFVNLPYRETSELRRSSQNIVCLFDNDLAGRKEYDALQKSLTFADGCYTSKKFKNEVFLMYVSDIEDQRMEEVVRDANQTQSFKNRLGLIVKPG